MISSTSVNMTMALAGLRRLEAQIYQAMMEAGATQAQTGNASSNSNPSVLLQNASIQMSQASQAIDSVDIKA